MKRFIKGLGITFLLVGAVISLFLVYAPHVDRAEYFDVVMVDGKLYFVPAEKYSVGTITVFISSTTPPNAVIMWSAKMVKDHVNYSQITYGQEGFYSEVGPKELTKGVTYLAFMGTSAKASLGTRGDFVIVDNNRVVMPHYFDPKRPKNRTLVIEKNGKKTTVPYSVTFDNDGRKVITSGPVPEN